MAFSNGKTSRASGRRWLVFGLGAALAVTLGAGGATAAWVARDLLPKEGATARGLRIDGQLVDPGSDVRAFVEARARARLGKPITLDFEGETALTATPEALGATFDVDRAVQIAERVAHEGSLWARIDDALEARAGRIDVPLARSLPVEPLAEALARFKDAKDESPRPAKLDVPTRTVTPHTAGHYVDVHETALSIDRAIARGEAEAAGETLAITPLASTEAVAAIDLTELVSSFETRFGYLGGQAGRAQNVVRAATQMDGVVLMPGEVVSFNENVGPRSIDNGFANAPEIYKGEMREGVGGGACQVASTLHAAAYLGGIAIVERSNHSRPSGYIRIGLDATVVYPIVDLKLKNPFSFPLVIHASIHEGELRFELWGKEKPLTVEFSSETVGVARYKRKVEEAAWLGEGETRLKQRGIKGYSIKKTRVIHSEGSPDQVEVTTDVYPPTFEIYVVPRGADVSELLPPLPGDDGDKRSAALTP